MFRRPVKTQEKEAPVPFKEQGSYLYGSKKVEGSEIPQRSLDSTSATPYLSSEEKMSKEDKVWNTPLASHPFQSILKEDAPETTLGEGVSFKGELSFERLLRIDGSFEGELRSQGKVVVGPKGSVKANLNLREAIIEGKIEGNLTIQERLELRGNAIIYGDIRAKSLIVDEGVTIVGLVEVPARDLIPS
jgi:cytoskeletal protein CcmA (bactofilin family)